MVKLFRFFAHNTAAQGLPGPKPTKHTIPQWYKDSESTYSSANGEEMAGLKKCMPYVDAIISGYVIPLPVDLHVSHNEDGTMRIEYDQTSLGEIIHERPAALGGLMPRPEGFAPNHLTFKCPWGWQTPKGFSVLVTHPFNREELPFHTITALMDSDEFIASGNLPFFIKQDFQGVIPAGTPIAQLIPIKRYDWKMIADDQTLQNKATYHGKIARDPKYGYKRVMWNRKEYN
jgi:hypothetical protein